MKLPVIRTLLLAPLVLLLIFYFAAVIIVATADRSLEPRRGNAASYDTIAIFGASGTAGDGLLKAALADSGIRKIHVITRRVTPRMEAGVAAGKVQVSQHMDYLDYAAVHEQISQADVVFWAIGISSLGVDEETYGRIHVDFPLQFVKEWLSVSDKSDLPFHFISSSDISEDSNAMWVRQKIRAEKALFSIGEGSRLRVIAYRPDYIGPTAEEAHLGQDLLYWFFRPVGAAVKATEIGQAMIEVTARGSQYANGAKVGTFSIVQLSDAYEQR